MVHRPGPVSERPLTLVEVPIPEPRHGEVLIRVEVCGVCRTDLHVTEGDLPPHKSPITPGHEVVGTIVKRGPHAHLLQEGDRVGVAWLFASCGACTYCQRGAENLCTAPRFTGYDVDGGYAEYLLASEAFVYPLPSGVTPVSWPPCCAPELLAIARYDRVAFARRAAWPLWVWGFSSYCSKLRGSGDATCMSLHVATSIVP